MISFSSFVSAFHAFFDKPLWAHEFFGNTLGEYAFAFLWGVVFWVVLVFLHWTLVGIVRLFSRRTKTVADDAFVGVAGTLNKWFYAFLALYAAIHILDIPEAQMSWFKTTLIIWTGYQVVLGFLVVVDKILEAFFEKNMDGDEDGKGESTRTFIGMIVRAVVWVAAFLFVLELVGVNVGALATGLGVGGVIIAFALQSVLSDLFSTFVIHAEKPFKPGDFIVVGEHRGTVKSIGIKTTRIQALQGEEIVISNQEMTSARVQNFKMMEERRVLVTLGVVYDTPIEKVRSIPSMIQRIVEERSDVRFGRAHFRSFGDSALEMELVYFILSNDYDTYMNAQQGINFAIMEAFARERIEFAFPTQMVYVRKE